MRENLQLKQLFGISMPLIKTDIQSPFKFFVRLTLPMIKVMGFSSQNLIMTEGHLPLCINIRGR